MVLKREDAIEIAEEPLPAIFDDLGSGPYIAPTYDFKALLRELFGIQYDPGIYTEDRRDEPQIPVGGADILPFPTVEGNELSDLVIAEVPTGPTEIFGEAASVSIGNAIGNVFDMEAYIRSSPYYMPGITYEGIKYMERQAAELQQIADMTPLQEAEAILMQPIGEAEVTDVADFFDDLGDVVVGVASQYLTGLVAPSPGATFVPPGFVSPIVAPAAPVAMAAPQACDTGPSPVYKKVCGIYKWVYPKRRRRRQLLTESDYNGLLRIESLKVNKNMTVAIAKALTR